MAELTRMILFRQLDTLCQYCHLCQTGGGLIKESEIHQVDINGGHNRHYMVIHNHFIS
jgi:hypothetical protein